MTDMRNSGRARWVESALATQALWLDTSQQAKPPLDAPSSGLPEAVRGLMAHVRKEELVLTQALWNN